MTSLAAAALWSLLVFLLVFVFVALVINERRKTKVGLGDGGEKHLMRAMRIHGNTMEQVPFVLAGLILMHLAGVGVLWIHVVGALFVATRIAYAFGIWSSAGTSAGRMAGMFGAWISVLIALVSSLLAAL